jgi:hypothetical protein
LNSKLFLYLFYFCVTLVFLMGFAGCDKLAFPSFGSKEGMSSDSGEEEQISGPQQPPPPSPSMPQSRVWYVSANGNNANSGVASSSPLASVQSALAKIRTIYRSGNWPAGESAVIVISGRIIASGSLGANETMIEIAGTGNYPPIVLQGDPVTGGILDVNRKKGEDGQVLLITNNKVTLGENLTLTGGNQLWGGAVRIGAHGFESEGEFIMAGGEISGNTGASGGAVIIYKGSMTMTGGAIKNNHNDYYNGVGEGGGIYVGDYTTFTMTGGIIESNGGDPKAGKGGGIFVNGMGTATMSGGEIRGNEALTQGGGVYIAPYGVFNMSDGMITGNKSSEGGGVYKSRYGGIFNQTGGTITGNTPA